MHPGAPAIPRVQVEKTPIPPLSARTRVVVTLGLPPLAQTDLVRRLNASSRAARKLNVASASSRAYLKRIDAVQRQAIRLLERKIPEARVSRRFRIVLDGFTVSLPKRLEPKLERLGFVEKAYPSFQYSMDTNRSGALIGATQLRAATGLRGDGIKVAVVDDGIDERNPFFAESGLPMPAGFPKGSAQFTNEKVIVAKSFPGPGSGADGRLPLDARVSFHGTHVAGVIAGKENTTAPDSTVINEEKTALVCVKRSGGCIPQVTGLSGVAPRAWVGNYRVFSVKDPLDQTSCCVANTPEIIAAFEAAVADGMDVINFSGGGPQSDPAADALIQATENVAKAGVVPSISAGNDRDLFGDGTVGSPSTAPSAISVAAVTNAHVFDPVLSLVSPSVGALQRVAYVAAPGVTPPAWGASNQALVDVGSITGDRELCTGTLPAGSLNNAIALVWSGGCRFEDKGARATAAGAIGLVVVNDHPGEAGGIPFQLQRPAGMIADLDGARLHSALAATGGRGTIRVGQDVSEIASGRGGTMTGFSSSGPTPFGHDLKPDVSAPGASILSSTVGTFAGANFAVLDGTSFSSPHVAGSAALLLERHPSWTPAQVKSALMSTAGPAFADTADTTEASVYLEGAGLVSLTDAIDPKLFTDPQSLSFHYLDVSAGGVDRTLLLQVSDAGGGAGTWQVEVRPQAATAGAAISVPSSLSLPSGGTAALPVVASAGGGAAAGDNYGFIVLRQGGVTRRVPYAFLVTRPQLATGSATQLQTRQTGDTRNGVDRVRSYRWPSQPFGLISLFGLDVPQNETGKEQVYYVDVSGRQANVGVTVVDPLLGTTGSFEDLLIAPIHPWFMGSGAENDVQGIAGTPVNTNGYMPGYLLDSRSAGTAFPRPGRYYVSIESGVDPFGQGAYAGPYVLKSWINDKKPPVVKLLTTRVSAGRPTIAFRATDAQSGIDPYSVMVDAGHLLTGAEKFDQRTGIAIIPLPRQAQALGAGRATIRLIASDNQESKNVNTDSTDLLPNTARRRVQVRVVRGPTLVWIAPEKNACVSGSTELDVVANSSAAVSSVGFFAGGRQIGRVRRAAGGVYSLTWNASGSRKARTLLAIVSDSAGREARAQRRVRVCG
jgi:minor extracellular serine protease Vpr